MTAYSLAERFTNFPGPCRVGNTDPGAYEITSAFITGKGNKVPFISSTTRKTCLSAVTYTDAIYDAKKSHRILVDPLDQQRLISSPSLKGGDTPFKSKVSRFKIQASTRENPYDEECLCKEKEDREVKKGVCQGEVYKKIYKGPPLRPKSGVSVPSKRHRLGYKVLQNGETMVIVPREPDNTLGPAFYRTSKTNFRCERYRGWRWGAHCPPPPSRVTPGSFQLKQQQVVSSTPGPADYQHERMLSAAELCAQRIRSERARTSRHIRFMDAVLLKCKLEQHPGPAHYTPLLPTGLVAPPVGQRAFISRSLRYSTETRAGPGPADYDVALFSCGRASVLDVPFGAFQKRFQGKSAEGPGPSDYEITRFADEQVRDPCLPYPPFGVSTILPTDKPDVLLAGILCPSKVFSDNFYPVIPKGLNRSSKNSVIEEPVELCQQSPIDRQICMQENSIFKSKRPRFIQPCIKYDEPSPADINVQGAWMRVHGPCVRRRCPQYLAPFNSSEGRFQVWRNFMSVNDLVDTPGPGALEVPAPHLRCTIFSKSKRFADWDNGRPAPNQYKEISKGVDDVNKTYNKRLALNTERGRTKLSFNYAKCRRMSRQAAPHRDPELALTARVVQLLRPDLKKPSLGGMEFDRGSDSPDKCSRPASSRVQYHVRDVVPPTRRIRRPGERVFLETFTKSQQVVAYF